MNKNMAYTNGNLALKPQRKPQPPVEEKKRIVVKRKTLPMQEKLMYLSTIILCVAVAGLIIFRYAQIYDLNLQIKKMNSEHQALSVEMEVLQRQVETLSNPERIKEMAESLGMVGTSDNGITIKTDAQMQSALRR